MKSNRAANCLTISSVRSIEPSLTITHCAGSTVWDITERIVSAIYSSSSLAAVTSTYFEQFISLPSCDPVTLGRNRPYSALEVFIANLLGSRGSQSLPGLANNPPDGLTLSKVQHTEIHKYNSAGHEEWGDDI